jgi:ubiquinone/menaquinone biosynthesis C-methylase UbiE
MSSAPPKPDRTPAEIYEQEMVPAIFARWAPELVDHGGARPGHRVLDVACGTGVVTRLLSERVRPSGRVVGLDLNPGMLAAARRAAASHKEIEWIEASVQSIPLPEAAFDVVVCQQGFQFFPDKSAALSEIRRVLAPGGRLALTVWRSVEHAPAFHSLERALARRVGTDKAALPPFSFGDAGRIRSLVSAAGFSDVRVLADVKMTRFASAEHFVRSVVAGAPSMLGSLAEQDPSVLESIVKEVHEELLGFVDDGGLGFPQANHIVTARR